MVAGGEQFGFSLGIASVDRADGVDNVSRREASARGGDGFASRQTFRMSCLSNSATLSEDFRSPCPMYRPIHAAAAEQTRVRGIHNRVDLLGSYIESDDSDASA